MFDKLKRMIGAIAAEEMIDPEALRQQQLLARLDAVLEGQGKLLAELKISDELGAAINERLARMDGALKGTGDGLADEIRKLKHEGIQMSPETIVLWRSVNSGLANLHLDRLAAKRTPPRRKRKRA